MAQDAVHARKPFGSSRPKLKTACLFQSSLQTSSFALDGQGEAVSMCVCVCVCAHGCTAVSTCAWSLLDFLSFHLKLAARHVIFLLLFFCHGLNWSVMPSRGCELLLNQTLKTVCHRPAARLLPVG